jgi:hypothetical protein
MSSAATEQNSKAGAPGGMQEAMIRTTSIRIWKGPASLFWLLPITYGLMATVLLYAVVLNPAVGVEAKRLAIGFVAPFCVVAPFGGWWAIFQCFRHERNPWPYAAILILIPLGFLWYYFERYRIRLASSETRSSGPNHSQASRFTEP